MNADERDPDLAKDFAALREEDRRAAPGLARLRDPAARRGHAPVAYWRPALAAALGLAILVAAGLWRAAQSPSPLPAIAAGDLLAWRSPTACLLDTPGRELLGEPSVTGSAIGAGAVLSPRRPNGAAAVSPMSRKEPLP
jgi:hypothetical protein